MRSSDRAVQEAYFYLMSMAGLPWEEVESPDPMGHTVAIAPEDSELVPPLMPIVVIGSTITLYHPQSRRSKEVRSVRLMGVDVPIFGYTYTAPGKRVGDMPIKVDEDRVYVCFDLFRETSRILRDPTGNNSHVLVVYSMLLRRLIGHLSLRSGIPYVHVMRWPFGVSRAVSLGFEIRSPSLGKIYRCKTRGTAFMTPEVLDEIRERDAQFLTSTGKNIGVLLDSPPRGSLPRIHDKATFFNRNKPAGFFLGSYNLRSLVFYVNPPYVSSVRLRRSSLGSPDPYPASRSTFLEVYTALIANNPGDLISVLEMVKGSEPLITAVLRRAADLNIQNVWISSYDELVDWITRRRSLKVDLMYGRKRILLELGSPVDVIGLSMTLRVPRGEVYARSGDVSVRRVSKESYLLTLDVIRGRKTLELDLV